VQGWSADGRLTVLDHHRCSLPHDVPAGDGVNLEMTCLPPSPGGFFTLNMVVEHVGWFETPTAMVDPAAADTRRAA
jgi:hypothetical protein